MPLYTDDQKRQAIVNAGFDPATHEIENDGNIYEKIKLSPTLSSDSIIPNKPSPAPQPSNYSPLETGAMSFGEAAPSAIGAGLGGAGGLALASWALGPEIGIPASVIAMLAGGTVGAAGTKALQNKIEPQSWQQNAAIAAAQNPKSAIAGNLASIPLGGFNPSPNNLIKGVGAGAKLLTGMEATAPELNALRNVGFGAGMGAVQPTINYAVGQGPAPTLGSTLGGAATGALFNEPNAIGGALGFGPTPEANPVPNDAALLAALKAKQSAAPVLTPVPQGNTVVPGDVLDIANMVGSSGIMKGKNNFTPEKSAAESGINMDMLLREGAQPVNRDNEIAQNVLEYQRSEMERQKAEQNLSETLKARTELNRQATSDTRATLINHALDLQQSLLGNQLSGTETRPEPAAVTPLGKEIPKDYTGVTEQDNTEVQKESPEDLLVRQEEAKLAGEQKPKYQEEPAITGEKALVDLKGNAPKPIGPTDLQPKLEEIISPNSSEGLRQIWKEIDSGNHRAAMNRIEYAYKNANPDMRSVLNAQMYVLKSKHGIEPSEQFNTDNPKYQEEPSFQKQVGKKLADKGIPISNVKEWNDVITKWAKPRFGVEIHEDGTITNENGKQVAGQAYLRNALREAFIKINPEHAGIDTLPHELHHVFMDYMEHYGSASDKTLIQKAYDHVASTPEFENAKNKNPTLDPNEFLASQGGTEFINRQLKLEGNTEFKQFWKDFTSHLKTKFTKSATLEDYTRLLNYKMINDPLHEGSRFNGTGGAIKNQDESKVSPDKQRYSEIQNRMSALIKEGNTGEEFKNLWREMEDIKNKTGGMPPKNQEIPEIRGKGSEGKTPYPFTLKELDKGESVLNEVHDTELSGKNGELFHIDEPSINVKNQGISDFNPFRSEVTRVRELEHPDAGKVADAFDEYYTKKRAYTGSIVNEAVGKVRQHVNYKNPSELLHNDNPDLQAVKAYFDDVADKVQNPQQLTTKQQAIKDDISASLKKMADKVNATSTLPRTIKVNPDYLPQMMSRKAMNTLLNKGGSAEHTQLVNDWYDYYTNTLHKTKAEADSDLQTLKDSFKGAVSKNIAAQFGPIDKASGLGLPRSWRENNLVDIMSRFSNRYARRLAYHDTIETNPIVSNALEDPIGGIGAQKNVKNITDDIAGIRDFSEDKRAAALGLIRSAMMGPLTGAKDFVSNITLGFQHQTPSQAVRSPIEAWKNISSNIADSFESGVNRHNISNLELGEGGIQDVTNLARRAGDILNMVQGRNYLEKINRATAYGQGRFLAMDNMASHAVGNLGKTGTKFMDDFGPTDWRNKTSLTPEEVMETAAKYTESVQGSYDYRGLPAIAMKGSLSPYLALARWNIEKFNNFNKYVIEPAKNGNFTPLLMQTIGAFIGGEAVTKLVEAATNRKERTPQLTELKALAKDKDTNFLGAAAYKLAGLASLSGYGGMMGDVVKSVFDKSFHNRAQSWDNPLVSGVENGAEHIFNVVQAINHGDLNITADAINTVLQDYFQAYRLTLNQVSGEQKDTLAKQDKFRDLKLWKVTHGMDVPDASVDTPNPFLNKNVKEFKKTDDIHEAAGMVPELVSNALKRAKGNIDVLRSELNSIKGNSYQTMPSPQRIPRTFLSYLNYLRETQGNEAATSRLVDYLKQNEINKVKSSLIPHV